MTTPASRFFPMIFRNYNLMAPAETLKDGDGARIQKHQPKGGTDVTSD
jgi:hypothetical protein